MSDVFFNQLGIPRPNHQLDIHGGSHGEMTGHMLIEIERILMKERPDRVLVIDKYLSAEELADLFSRDLLFILPHRAASQSGVLYTLLHHGKYFLGFDVGDIGRFFRDNGLEDLIIGDISYEIIESKISWMNSNADFVKEAFIRAQERFSWELGLE